MNKLIDLLNKHVANNNMGFSVSGSEVLLAVRGDRGYTANLIVPRGVCLGFLRVRASELEETATKLGDKWAAEISEFLEV